MNAPAITTRIADLVRNPNSAMPNEWEHSIQKKQTEAPTQSSANRQASTPAPPKPEYSVDFSPLAQKILEESDAHESDWEKTRSESIMRIQRLVQEKQYNLAPEMVDGIAQKIVAMLP